MLERVMEYCNKCKKHTVHNVKAETLDIDPIDSEIQSPEIWRKQHQILECVECKKSITRIREREFNPYEHPLSKKTIGGYSYTEIHHPDVENKNLAYRELSDCPSIIIDAYKEIVFCYNSDMLIVGAATAKVLLDSIIEHYGIVGKLGEKDMLTFCCDVLKMDFGKALLFVQDFCKFKYPAFSEIYQPNKAELRIIIEFLEDILIRLFPL